jgi:hypothetical protein
MAPVSTTVTHTMARLYNGDTNGRSTTDYLFTKPSILEDHFPPFPGPIIRNALYTAWWPMVAWSSSGR